MPAVAIVGIGRLGGALAIALSRHGYEIRELVHRGRETAFKIVDLIPSVKVSPIADTSPIDADIVLITTPDPDIENVAMILRDRIGRDAIVLHTSGSLGSDILSTLANSIGSLHPLVSISDADIGASRFADAYFCIEGDARAIEASEKIVAALGGKSFSIDTALKPLYHASAVMASGHFVALEDMAIEMLSSCGLTPDTAKSVLLPLIRSAVGNLEKQSTEKALTGTFARADVDAFERHMASFEGPVSSDIRLTYLLLAERSLELAEKAGIDSKRSNDLRRRLASAKHIAKANPE